MLYLARMANNSDGQSPVKLPLRRRAQLVRVMAGESVTDASLAVGYKSAQSGHNAMADTRKRLLSAMDHYNLTPDTLIRDYLIPLLNATKTQFFAKDGVVMDERIVEDNGTRLSALDMTWKLRGAYPKDDSDGPSHMAITINNVGTLE